MYPDKLFLDMDLYSILLLVGILACMVLIRVLADRRKLRAAWQNLALFGAVIAVVLGYGGAVLFQAFYNYMEDGKFVITNSTGATFYGGLIGGTVIFIILYFVVGHFLFKDGYHKTHFRTASDIAAPCICIAHGFGRLGCLMAGCCHGARTNAWYGIVMKDLGYKVVPVQLFEAIFLFGLGALTLILFLKKKPYLLSIYMIAYGLWRFVAEYLRADDRGATVVDFLSPSQLISVLLIAGGLVLLAILLYVDQKKKKSALAADTTAASADTVDAPEAPVNEPETEV